MNTLPTRKPTRLKNFDYSQNGMYFITICTKDMKCVLCTIKNVGEGFHTLPQILLNPIGVEIEKSIHFICDKYENISIDKYVIMPNHVHMLISIDNPAGGCGNPPLQEIIRQIKTYTTKQYGAELWQRSFSDHIIRDEEDYLNHLQYIDENPRKWLIGKDEYYV